MLAALGWGALAGLLATLGFAIAAWLRSADGWGVSSAAGRPARTLRRS